MKINKQTNIFTLIQIKQLLSLYDKSHLKNLGTVNIFDNKTKLRYFTSRLNSKQKKKFIPYTHNFSGGFYSVKSSEVYLFLNPKLINVQLEFETDEYDDIPTSVDFYNNQITIITFVYMLTHEIRHNFQRHSSKFGFQLKREISSKKVYKENYDKLIIENDARIFTKDFLFKNYEQIAMIFDLYIAAETLESLFESQVFD